MTQIRGVYGAVEDDGTTPWKNRIEDIRSLVWDAFGQRQGIVRGFESSLDAGSLSMTLTAGAAVVEERGTDSTGDARAYYLFNDTTTQVVFDSPGVSSRTDAVVFCWGDAQYGTLGVSVASPGGPQVVAVAGSSSSPLTDGEIEAEIGAGGWFRYADVTIDPGDTEVNPANVTDNSDRWVANTGWVALTGFGSGYSARSGAYAPAYRLWSDGRVELRGGVQKSSALGQNDLVLTLPAAVRPASTVVVSCGLSRTAGGTTGRLDINTDGTVRLNYDTEMTGGANWFHIDAIVYDLT